MKIDDFSKNSQLFIIIQFFSKKYYNFKYKKYKIIFFNNNNILYFLINTQNLSF